jgi:hypothetical protein
MATAILYAISHVEGNVTTPNAALGAPDGVFTGNIDAEDWTSRWRLDLPPDGQVDVAQSLTVTCRKQTGSGTPELEAILYVNDALVGSLGTVTVTSATGQDDVFTMNLTARDGDNVSIELVCTAVGGNPNTRASVQIDSIRWDCSYSPFEGSAFQGWDGGAWVSGLLKKWDGAAWIPARVQRYDGNGWVNVP